MRGGLDNKKGQVTIFIIIAIVIVALGVVVFIAYPKIRANIESAKNPEEFIQTCIEDKIIETVDKVSVQGGSVNPELYYTFDGENIEYLCYTVENYKECVVQQPLLEQHIESEIEDEIQPEVDNCFDDLKKSYENKGYSVSLKKEGGINIDIFPEKIISNLKYSVSLTKDSTERYDSFSIVLNNNLYWLVNIAEDILDSEQEEGGAVPETDMIYYPTIRIESFPQTDGSKIYILTDKNNKQFKFAVRSGVLPSGRY